MSRWKFSITLVLMVELIAVYKCEDTCLEVMEVATRCLDDGPLEIKCPTDYLIRITEATIKRLVDGLCTNTAITAGEQEACKTTDTSTAKASCEMKYNCSVTDPEPTSGSCDVGSHTGGYYLSVQYYCLAEMKIPVELQPARPFYICDEITWSGTLAHINNFATLDLDPVGEMTCSSKVSVSASTRVIAQLVFAIKPDGCAQHIQITDGYTIWKLCDKRQTIELGCAPQPTDYYISYVTNNPNELVTFTIGIFVHSTSSLALTCSPNLMTPPPTTPPPATTTAEMTTMAPTTVADTTTTPPPTTVAPTTVAPTTVAPTTVAPTTVAPTTVASTTVAPTTVAPTTVASTTVSPPTTTTVPTTTASVTTAQQSTEVKPTADSVSKRERDKVPIIIGAVCGSILFLLIIIIIIIIRWRKEQYDEQQVAEKERELYGDNMMNVTSVYMDGTHESQLIVGNRGVMPRYYR